MITRRRTPRDEPRVTDAPVMDAVPGSAAGPPAQPGGSNAAPLDVRPHVSAAWALCASAGLIVGFAIFAALLPRSAALGDAVRWSDRVSMFGLGVVVAAIVALPAWPRVHADARGIRTRGFIGGYRFVPWSAIRAVEFPERGHWAVAVLDREETTSLYAIQRVDADRSVQAMDDLRALLWRSRRESDSPHSDSPHSDSPPSGERQPEQ
jgi:hypothetical protein